MNRQIDTPDFIKTCEMINSVTKLDIQLIRSDGSIQFQIINHPSPIIFEHFTKLNNRLQKLRPDQYYYYVHPIGMEYIACGLWVDDIYTGYILIGPFISSTTIIELIQDIIHKNNFPISERKNLKSYFQSLPVISETEYTYLGEVVINLCIQPLIQTEKISSDIIKPILNQNLLRINIEENKQLIENRYEQQNKLMDAITRGDKVTVNHLLDISHEILDFSDRIPGSPIRSSKNIAFVSNTLFRVAAESSGVHPVYLHNISERFAILIERTTTLPSLQKLIVLMANEYCDLVRTVSTGHFSPDVKKTVDYIMLNIGDSITLKHIADYIHINPSYLSRKFKQETGMTITEFINRRRIDEAKLYLQRGNISITDVAFMVGFNDVNYFTKVFKKFTNQTPTQFVKRSK